MIITPHEYIPLGGGDSEVCFRIEVECSGRATCTTMAMSSGVVRGINYLLDDMRLQIGEDRAKSLLLSLLSDTQGLQLRHSGHFYVTGSAGGRYRLGPDTLVYHKECGYCIMPKERVPEYDRLAAVMLLLQTDEPAFARIANLMTFESRHA